MASFADQIEDKALGSIEVELWVVLGTSSMPIHQLLRMGRGAIIALDTTPENPVKIYVNRRLVALGEIQINDDRIAVRVTEVIHG